MAQAHSHSWRAFAKPRRSTRRKPGDPEHPRPMDGYERGENALYSRDGEATTKVSAAWIHVRRALAVAAATVVELRLKSERPR